MNSKIVHDLFLFFDDSEAIEMSEGAVTNDVDAKEAVMMVWCISYKGLDWNCQKADEVDIRLSQFISSVMQNVTLDIWAFVEFCATQDIEIQILKNKILKDQYQW